MAELRKVMTDEFYLIRKIKGNLESDW
jgi:hypothetical protein